MPSFASMTSFELAPRSRRHDLDKALAFAVAPAAPTFAAIYFFTDGLALASIVTAACFLGTFLCGLTLASTPIGRLALSRDELLLDSGHLHVRIPLAELDLAAAHSGASADSSFRLSTRSANSVTIPRRSGSPVIVTPLDPAAFLRALHAFA